MGACPICSGMAGAPKDRNKPRKSGEMSYNECLAQWHKMQRMDARKEQNELKDKLALENASKNQKTSENSKSNFELKMENFISKLDVLKNSPKASLNPPLNILSNALLKPALFVAQKVAEFALVATKFVFGVLDNVRTFLNSVGEKLSSFLGEIKNFIQGFNFSKIKERLKIVLSLFLGKDQEGDEENEKAKEENLRLRLREIKSAIIKTITKKERKIREEENEKPSPDAI